MQPGGGTAADDLGNRQPAHRRANPAIVPAALVPGGLLPGTSKRIGEYAMNKIFGNAATAFAHAAGKPGTFMLAALSIVVWLGSGPLFGFSDTWQLVINTGSTILHS
jgi:hypothetical protein